MKKWWLRVFLGISFLESGIFLYLQLLNLQELAEFKPVFSLFNIITLVFLALIIVGMAILLILDLRSPTIRTKLERIAEQDYLFWGMLIFFSLIFIESGQNLLFLRADLRDIFFPFFLLENLIIFQWAFLISLQAIILMVGIWFRSRKSKENIKIEKNWMIGIGLVFLILMILTTSGTGFVSRSANIVDHGGTFGTTNAPLPMVQVGFIWLALTAVWLLQKRFLPHWKFTKSELIKNLLIITIIWAAAFMVWSNVPLTSNYFVDEIRAPNDQHNPISDSIYYETQAHRLLSGEGFFEKVQHPLYGYILSGLHLVGGDHYEDIYLFQIAILAIMPVLVFKLTSLMLSPFAGWLTSFLFIAREYNALILGDSITITNVQLIMTESVTQMGVILVVYLLITWITKPERSRKGLPFLIGSVIGLLALIRVEMLSLALVFIAIGLILYWRSWKIWFWRSMVMIAAILVLTVPWMARNWQVTGNFSLDKGEFFRREILTFTNFILGADQKVISAQNEVQIDPDLLSLSKVQKIIFHTSSSLSESVLYLPSNHQPMAGIDNYLYLNPEKGKIYVEKGAIFSDRYLTGYVKTLPYWNMNWDGFLEPWSLLPISLVLLLSGQGLFLVWRKNPLTALTPLFVLVIHVTAYSFFSSSGGRFIQAVDWITLVYFSMGLSWVSSKLGQLLGFEEDLSQLFDQGKNRVPVQADAEAPARISWGVATSILTAVIIGLSMPAVEALVPPRYTMENLLAKLDDIDLQLLSDIDLQEGSEKQEPDLLYGKAIYPGFYQAGEIMLDDRNGKLPDGNTSRLDFYLVGMENIWVSIPLDQAPDYFPHGSEVIIEGYETRNSPEDLENRKKPYFLAERVFILDDDNEIVIIIND